MPYKGLDALKAKITDPVVRKWADTLKSKSRTKLFTFLQFWDWSREVRVKDPKTGEERVGYWQSGEELLADYDRCALPATTPEEKFRHLRIAMEFVKNKGLTVGTQIWIDATIQSPVSGTTTIQNCVITAFEF